MSGPPSESSARRPRTCSATPARWWNSTTVSGARALAAPLRRAARAACRAAPGTAAPPRDSQTFPGTSRASPGRRHSTCSSRSPVASRDSSSGRGTRGRPLSPPPRRRQRPLAPRVRRLGQLRGRHPQRQRHRPRQPRRSRCTSELRSVPRRRLFGSSLRALASWSSGQA